MATLRKHAGSIGAGACALSLVLTTGSSTPTKANPPARTFDGPMQRTAVHRVRRFDATNSSCSSAPPATSNAFDSSTTFMTNNVEVFGYENLASAQDAGVFVGNENAICDSSSAIVAGFQNLVDSGNGSNGSVAKDSFIGAGSNNSISTATSFVGAGESNKIKAQSAFIGAGNTNAVAGNDSFIGAGYNNEAEAESSVVAGGVWGSAAAPGSFVGGGGDEYYIAQSNKPSAFGNIAGATDSFVGAGDLNQIASTGYGSFIGAGGYQNALQKINGAANSISAADSFIGAGDNNSIAAGNAVIGGGDHNSVAGNFSAVVAGEDNAANGGYSFIGGGVTNSASGTYAAVAGGNDNKATGERGFVGGGYGNSASAAYAMVPGGDDNTAGGTASFAAGHLADATQKGSFVWSDESGSSALKDTAANQFVARATGGFYFYTSSSGAGAELRPGSGAWASLSDRNAKTSIVPLDDASVLAKVAALPLSSWQYKSERGVTHVGPMAQDFYAAFGVGEDNRHITSIDEDGVALAAIKALNAKLEAKDREIAALNANMRRFAAALAELQRHR